MNAETSEFPLHYSPLSGIDVIADLTSGLAQSQLRVLLCRSGSMTFYIRIERRRTEGSKDMDVDEIRIPAEKVFAWAKKHTDLDTYIKLYGMSYGYEGQMPASMAYDGPIGSKDDEVAVFVRSVLALCAWDFVEYSFIHDLYHNWHKRYYPGKPPIDWYKFISRLDKLVGTNYQHTQIGWDYLDYWCAIQPTILMRNPEPLIQEFQLENWMPLLYGSCSEQAAQYDPKLSKSWIEHLEDDICLANGLLRTCKCNFPILQDRPLFRDSENM